MLLLAASLHFESSLYATSLFDWLASSITRRTVLITRHRCRGFQPLSTPFVSSRDVDVITVSDAGETGRGYISGVEVFFFCPSAITTLPFKTHPLRARLLRTRISRVEVHEGRSATHPSSLISFVIHPRVVPFTTFVEKNPNVRDYRWIHLLLSGEIEILASDFVRANDQEWKVEGSSALVILYAL